MKRTSGISFRVKGGFPDSEYAFCDGMLSAVVDSNGGISEIAWDRIGYEEGVPFPDVVPLRVLGRDRSARNHPHLFYGPPLRFVSTHRGGPNVHYVPEAVEILPFGFRGESRHHGPRITQGLCLSDGGIFLTFGDAAADREDLVLVFYPEGLLSGPFASPRFVGTEPPETVLAWEDPVFDEAGGMATVRGTLRGPGVDETFLFAVGAAAPGVRCVRDAVSVRLHVPWSGRTRLDAFVLPFCPPGEIAGRAASFRKDPDGPWERQTRRYRSLARRVPALDIAGTPSAGEFFRMAPLFLESMVLAGDDRYLCRRASTSGFGFWWQWDSLYPLLGMMDFCDTDGALKVLEYTFGPGARRNMADPLAMLLAVLCVHECAAVAGDAAVVRRFLPRMKEEMELLLAGCDGDGMLLTGAGTGADDPAQVGVEGPSEVLPGALWRTARNRVATPDHAGLWYSALRFMENTAVETGDDAFAGRMRACADRVRERYLPLFYDEEAGYLCVSVASPSGRKNRTFQNVVTMAMDGLYGPDLLDARIDRIGAFIENQLAHPRLRVSVPFWNGAAEMWHGTIMLQHSAHESRTLRFAGRGGELLRYFRTRMAHYERFRNGMETLNLSELPGQIHQDRKWQAFGARALYALTLQSILGLEPDRGGITYIPCDLPLAGRISRLKTAGLDWTVRVKGKGAWVASVTADGRRLAGTWKVSPSALAKRRSHTVLIERGPRPPDAITLARAPWLEVRPVSASRATAVFELSGWARSPVRIVSRRPVAADLDGRPLPVRELTAPHTYEVEAPVRDRAILTVRAEGMPRKRT